MIGFLRGVLVAKSPPGLTVDVGGVGYDVEAPMSTFYTLPPLGAEIRLLTHLAVREDAQTLYGFSTEDERRLFRNLLKVSGVGPRSALAILSGVSVEAFAQCVRAEDIAALTKIPGVGRKTAERLVIEMRDRLDAPPVPELPGVNGQITTAGGAEGEAFSALLALGYKAAEATRMLKLARAAPGGDAANTEELIRRALQGAAREIS
jgi:holliday junction DNA helicase RuvA